MSFKLASTLLRGSAISAVAALGVCLAVPAQAQSYDNNGPYAPTGTYADTSADVGGVTVTAPYRQERTFTGAPIVTVQASRIVPISDLDLSTGEGMDVLHHRVERAAYSACNELDQSYTMGLYPVGDDSNTDCAARAVGNAMASAPVGPAPGAGY